MRRLYLFASALIGAGAIGVISACAEKQPDAAWRDAPQIAYSYHGVLIDTNGKAIKLNPATAIAMHEKLFHLMLKYVPPQAQKEEREFREKVLAGLRLGESERMMALNLLVSRLASKYEKSIPQRLAYASRLLRRDIVMLDPKLIPARDRKSPSNTYLADSFQDAWDNFWDLFTGDAADKYAGECRAKEVPMPPDWGGAWTRKETLDQPNQAADEIIFASQAIPKVELWTFQDPNVEGGCAALPRKEANGTLVLNGMICQSKTTGRACFWDNISRFTGQKISSANYRIRDIQNGDLLAENCTECHRGPNVFLMHPGTKIEFSLVFPTNPDTRYQPVSSQTDWKNPEPFLPKGNNATGCLTCHEIPGLGGTYCDAIAKNAIEKTMPRVDSPAKWDLSDPQSPYRDHVQQIRQACESGNFNPPAGATPTIAEGKSCSGGDPQCDGTLVCGYRCTCSTGLNVFGVCIGGESAWICITDSKTCMKENEASVVVGQ